MLMLAAGCASNTTWIEQSWRSPTARPDELRNVVTLAAVKDGTIRRTAEDKLAAQLAARGMHAVPSYAALHDADFQDRGQVIAALQNQGFDGIVTMRFVGAQKELEYYPSFYAYWGNTWGSVIPETIVRIEINAYALQGDHLIWSAMSKSVDPNNLNDLINDVTQVAARDLQRQRLIATTQSAQR